jgi:hypothetical protein
LCISGLFFGRERLKEIQMSQYDAELYQKFVGNVATEVCLSANTDINAALVMRSCIARIISVEIRGFASSKRWILRGLLSSPMCYQG